MLNAEVMGYATRKFAIVDTAIVSDLFQIEDARIRSQPRVQAISARHDCARINSSGQVGHNGHVRCGWARQCRLNDFLERTGGLCHRPIAPGEYDFPELGLFTPIRLDTEPG